MKRFFSKNTEIAAIEHLVVAVLGVLLFCAGFVLGQMWSIGNLIIWLLGG